ncbi:scamp family-domain-containing protein [Zopfochytrium polystomum]|nr:scamp family-domain-containing protein [Zopfochytrium polystomum]
MDQHRLEFADPFADPAIADALNQSAYAPLADDASVTAVLPTTSTSASAGLAGAGGASLAQDLRAKEAELARREEELARREAGLQEQEQAMRQHGFRPPNWPPFYPLIHHDIDGEIPELSRSVMKKIYFFWLATLCLLVWNFVTCLSLLITKSTPNAANDFGVSLIYCFTITAMSFYLWYRPIYIAYSKDSSLFFYIFLLFEGCHIAFSAYMFIGFSGSGSGGLINFLAALGNSSYFTAFLCAVDMAGWAASALFAFWMWTDVHRHTKQGGHSIGTARAQAMQMGVLGG